MNLFINGQPLSEEVVSRDEKEVERAWQPLYRTSVVIACLISVCFSFTLRLWTSEMTSEQRYIVQIGAFSTERAAERARRQWGEGRAFVWHGRYYYVWLDRLFSERDVTRYKTKQRNVVVKRFLLATEEKSLTKKISTLTGQFSELMIE